MPIFTTEILPYRDLVAATPRSKAADLKGTASRAGISADRGAVDARVLQHEFGVNQTEMEFWMERVPTHSHAGGTGKPPPGVTIHQIPIERASAR